MGTISLYVSVKIIDTFELEGHTFAIHKTVDTDEGFKPYSVSEMTTGLRALDMDIPDVFTAQLMLEEKLKDPEMRKRLEAKITQATKKKGK